MALADDPRAARERLEEELRGALQARSVRLRDDGAQAVGPPPDAVCFDVASSQGDGRARLEVIFDKPRPLDDWTCQLIEAATQLASWCWSSNTPSAGSGSERVISRVLSETRSFLLVPVTAISA